MIDDAISEKYAGGRFDRLYEQRKLQGPKLDLGGELSRGGGFGTMPAHVRSFGKLKEVPFGKDPKEAGTLL